MMENKAVTVTCADGVELTGTLYSPDNAHAAVMIAPATGIRRQVYHHFASFLCERGYLVITFDNRGIGDSLHGAVKDSRADLIQWGALDMPAVLTFLKKHSPGLPTFLTGHSAGGQLIGLMHNADELDGFFNVACSSGSLRNMTMPYRLKAHFFMNVFIPLSNSLLGYTKSQWFGMGEPLPPGVASQWRHWCNGTGYIETEFGRAVTKHWYHEIDTPGMWVLASDDDIANEANVKDMMRVFRQSDGQYVCLEPAEHGLDDIGHMRFFSRQSQTLWPMAIAFFARLIR